MRHDNAMKKGIYKKSALSVVRTVLGPLLFTAAVMGMIMYGLHQTEQSSRSEGRRILEDSIRHAVIVSYAVEGRYPESIAYLEENFGITIDRSKYKVHYSIFATNFMPDITIIELKSP